MRLRIQPLQSTGDTIIEVLFSITILAVVLGGSYAISNKATTTNRQNNERSQALKYAESQAEQLKAVSVSSANVASYKAFKDSLRTDGYCLSTAGARVNGVNCVKDSRYTIQTKYYPSAAGVGVEDGTEYFKVTVTWDNDVAAQTKTVEILYRAYHLDKS